MAKLKYIISEAWKSDKLVDTIEFCEFAARFFQFPDNLMVTIKLTNGFEEGGTTEKLRNNRYEIRVSGNSAYNPLLVIAHEFCHVWQMHSGVLEAVTDTKSIYCGIEYEAGNDPVKYLSAPYEVEARAYEEIMFAVFEHDLNHTISDLQQFLNFESISKSEPKLNITNSIDLVKLTSPTANDIELCN